MLILGLDFETTGLNIPTIGVTEVGMVLWNTELKAPIKLYGTLVDPGPDVVWEPSAIAVNNLTPELCTQYGMQDEKACRQVMSWYSSADVCCAHNGNVFDRPILNKWATKYGIDPQKDKVWIDTKADLETPPRNSTRLTYMAADHAFLNPFPHRAMFDVMTMLKILDKYDLDEVLVVSKSPTVRLKAIVSFEQKDLAKNRGFHPIYVESKFSHWEMSTKECKLDREREACRTAGFEVAVIK